MSYSATSIIFDIENNWGDASNLGVRRITLYLTSSAVTVYVYESNIYATSTYDGSRYNIFDSSKSLTGSASDGWIANAASSQRVILGDAGGGPFEFDRIDIENSHDGGLDTDQGIKNLKIHVSSDSISSTTYDATISNGTLIFNGQVSQHASSDAADPETIWNYGDPVGSDPEIEAAGGAIVGGTAAILRSPNRTTAGGGAVCGGAAQIEAPAYVTAKSVVFDFANSHGAPTSIGMGLRHVAFSLGNDEILLLSNFLAYSTTTDQEDYLPGQAFEGTLSKTGSWTSQAWLTGTTTAPERLVIVFDLPQKFNKITVDNSHNSGMTVTTGVKDTVIHISLDSITSTVYGEAVSGIKIFDNYVPRHVDEDEADPVEIWDISGSSTNPQVTAKSVVLDIANNWGHWSELEVRAVCFYLNGEELPIQSRYTAYSTSIYNSNYTADKAFNTDLIKIGPAESMSFRADFQSHTNQRLSIVFDSALTFDALAICNAHNTGASTDKGIKATVITISSDDITDTTYNAEISNSRVLFDGTVSQHPVTNTESLEVVWWEPGAESLGGSVLGGYAAIWRTPLPMAGAGGGVVAGTSELIAKTTLQLGRGGAVLGGEIALVGQLDERIWLRILEQVGEVTGSITTPISTDIRISEEVGEIHIFEATGIALEEHLSDILISVNNPIAITLAISESLPLVEITAEITNVIVIGIEQPADLLYIIAENQFEDVEIISVSIAIIESLPDVLVSAHSVGTIALSISESLPSVNCSVFRSEPEDFVPIRYTRACTSTI